MYALYDQVIRPSRRKTAGGPLEKFVKDLAKSGETIPVYTLGAPARHGQGNSRTIGSLVRHGSTSSRSRRVLCHLIRYFDCARVFELGTSLGLTTLYLSEDPQVNVTTFEGNHDLAARAMRHFRQFSRKNIRLAEGNIDNTLPQELSRNDAPDLVYIDANHRYGPTLNYADQCIRYNPEVILVIGDIHWSPEMTRAWNVLAGDPRCKVSVDLYEAGILLYGEGIPRGEYVM